MDTRDIDTRFYELERHIGEIDYRLRVLYEIFGEEIREYYEDLEEQEKEDLEKIDKEETKREGNIDKNGKRTRERIKEE